LVPAAAARVLRAAELMMGVTGDDDGDGEGEGEGEGGEGVDGAIGGGGVVACAIGDRRDKGDARDVRVRTGGVDGGESGEGNDEPRSSLLGVDGVDTVGALPPCECCEAMRDCEAERLDDGNRGRLNGREGEVESGCECAR
jgi:hypothetical protein